MIYKWENCKKCPREICLSITDSRLYDGANFYIKVPCTRVPGKFHAHGTANLPLARSSDDLVTLIVALLDWPDLQLEDALQLTKIRNMI